MSVSAICGKLDAMAAERLQKIIAAAGIASRRKAEEFIAAGRVSLNGVVVTEQGTKADPAIDKITIDGKLVFSKKQLGRFPEDAEIDALAGG